MAGWRLGVQMVYAGLHLFLHRLIARVARVSVMDRPRCCLFVVVRRSGEGRLSTLDCHCPEGSLSLSVSVSVSGPRMQLGVPIPVPLMTSSSGALMGKVTTVAAGTCHLLQIVCTVYGSQAGKRRVLSCWRAATCYTALNSIGGNVLNQGV